MIYIRNIFTQDLRDGKQIAFPTEPSNIFFKFSFSDGDPDRRISFKFKETDFSSPFYPFNGKIINTRLYSAKSESRIDGELKQFLRDDLKADVDDVIVFRALNKDSYEFEFIPDGTISYRTYKNILNGRNHELAVEDDKFDNGDSLTDEKVDLFTSDEKTTQADFNLNSFQEKTQQSNLNFSSTLILRFIASLTSKPFVILSGLSGSGKTKIAQSFAQWISESDSQYKIVPVGADWTNREPLIGYPNGLNAEEYITPDSGVIHLLLEAISAGNENKPFFLILDEMNLSHVERYFADFLSIMESKDKMKLYTGKDRISIDGKLIPQEIGWPKNVFIIGTVNIDETTYMFSPKVLDRANVIEFRINEEEIKTYLDNPGVPDLKKLEREGISMAESFLKISANDDIEKNEDLSKELVLFFNQLKNLGAEFGYRSATEILQLVSKLKMLDPSLQDKDNQCLDIAIMQKLLPKLHGSRSKLVKILVALGEICLVDSKDAQAKYFDSIKFENYAEDINVKYPISCEKLTRMYKNVLANGFTSYAEA